MYTKATSIVFRYLRRPCVVFLLAAASISAEAPTNGPSDLRRIANLYFHGNRVTKTHIIKMYCEIDSGMYYDSIKIRRTKERIEATNLFAKVAIVPIEKNGAIDLHVIVKEHFYLRPSAIDFSPYTSRYGQRGMWICPLLGIERANFRGRMETLRMSLQLWEWRSASISWSKPLLPSRYFVGIGAFADLRPDYAKYIDRLDYAGNILAGKRCFSRSKLYCSVIPDYQRTVFWRTERIDTSHYYQAFGSLGWLTDRRSPGYDPRDGWAIFLETRSNYLYHEKNTPPYAQMTSDVKFYHRGPFSVDRAAYHAAFVYRTRDAGIQNRLTLGGVGSVRGYGIGGIDLLTSANASVLFSCEYRFPIYQFASVSRLAPRRISEWLSGFLFDPSTLSPRLDGALIFDCGRVARRFETMVARGGPGYISGADIGFGLRLMERSLRWSGSFDVVWRENPYTRRLDFSLVPSPMLYLDLPF